MREGVKQAELKARSRIVPGRLLCSTSLSALVLLALPSVAQAQDANRNWDANGTALGNGGTGTWSTTGENWSPNTDGTSGPYVPPWDNTLLDNAIFGGTAGTVTLGVPITVHNITFNTNGYTLTGNTLTLAGTTPTITVTSGTSAISSTINASGGLTKAGVGTLNLSGNNSFADLTVNAGALNLTGNNSLTGAVNLNAGTLSLTGTNSYTGTINVNGGTLFAGSNAALGAAGNVVNLANGAVLNSSGSLAGRTVNLTGGLGTAYSLAGSAHFTGVGGLSIVAVGSTGSITMSDNTNDFTGNVNLVVNNAAAVGFSSIGNAGQASALGAGDTINFQANTGVSGLYYSGTGSSSNRNWQITTGGGAPTAVIQNNGSGTLTLTGNMSATGATSVALIASSADIQALGVLSGSASNAFRFIASGAGTVTLGNANTFTGTASIESGAVRVGTLADEGAISSLGAGAGISIVNGTLSYTGAGASSNRTFSVSGTTSAIRNDSLTGALSLTGATSLAGNLTLGGSYTGSDNTLSGVVSGSGGLVSAGPATWVLAGANTRTGTVTVSGGTLRAGSATAFGTTTGIVTTGGTLDLNGFNMSTTSLTGTGGTIALGGANLALTLGVGVSNTYGGSIAGGGSLTKLGTGTLTLTGANSYTGPTTVGAGTLKLDFTPAGAPASDIIAPSSVVNLSGGSTLSVVGAAGETNSQSFAGLNVTSGSNTISLVEAAGGTLTLNLGAISRTGGTVNFAPGTNAATTGTFTTTNADGELGGWAIINNADYAKVLGGQIVAFDAADYDEKDDAGTWATGDIVTDADGDADSFFGTVTSSIQLGGLRYSQADATPNPNLVTIAAGQTLGVDGAIIVAPTVGSSNQTITGGFLTGSAGGGAVSVQQSSTGTYTIASTIIDNGGATGFTKGGTGLVVLSGPNSYTGATTVSQGILSVSTIGNGGAASNVGASTSDASNLVIDAGTLRYTGATATTDRGFTLTRTSGTTGPIDVTLAGTNLTFSGLITSPDGAGLTKTGPGTLTLANAANDYTGVTTISGGTLSVATLANGGAVSGIGASPSASSNLVLQGGGELEYTGGTATVDRGFTLNSGGGAIDVTQAGTTLRLNGTAMGVGALAKNGSGTLILGGTNSHSGGTTVNAGTLRAGSTQAFGTTGNNMTVNAGATLDLANLNNSVGALNGGGAVTLGSATLTTTGSGSFSGAISGTNGRLTVAGGMQTITGCTNSYTGATTITGSSVLNVGCLADGLAPSDIGASTSASSNLVFSTGALNYTGATVSTNRGFTLQAGTGAIGVQDGASTLTFSGVVTGAGNLRKDGAGTLVLSGANDYSGGTTITGATLRAGSTSAFGTGWMTVNAGTTLDLNGFNNTVSALAGAGNVTLGSAMLTLSNGGLTFSGGITGSGGLTKNGTGAQTLSGCNSSYDGPTAINGGILSVNCLANGGSASAIGDSGPFAGNLVVNGGTLQYTGAATSTDRLFTLGASTASKIEASGTGALAFINAGAIAFSSPDTAQTLTLGGTNTGNNSLAALITNNSAGITSLTKTDAGAWILTNPNSTYTGVTTILGGVLGVDKLANGGEASSIGRSSELASNLVIGSGSTLRYTGAGDSTNRLFTLATGVTFIESSGTGAIAFTNTGSMAFQGSGARVFALGGTSTGNNVMGVTIIDGTGGATTVAKNDAGTWSLTGTNTYTGPTNINAGILNIGNGGTTGSIASATVNNFGTLGFNRSNTLTYAGTIVGTGAVNQLGSGTTVLTGANTYSGGTTISAGTLQLGNGGATGSIVGNVTNNGALTFNRNNAYTFGGTISGTGAVNQIGTGTTILTGTNSYSGGTSIAAGTLQVSSDANLGAASGGLTFNSGTLRTTANMISARAITLTGAGTFLTDPSTTLTLSSAISGDGALTKTGAGTLRLIAASSYTGGTTVQAGILALGDGTTAGSVTGDILNNGEVTFNSPGTQTYAGTITGTGHVNKNGTGTMVLTGNNAYSGFTQVTTGTLIINGDQSGATGATSVFSTGILGGSGVIGGNVSVSAFGRLSPGNPGNAPGTLTINGNLSLASTTNLDFNFGQANVPGGPLNDLISVGGNLTLDGTLNVTQSPGGTFGPGVYRIFNYGGALTNNGLNLASPDYFVQTSAANQVNLVNSAGLTLSFWDGDAGPHSNSVINGGNGTWRAAGDQNWTDVSGLFAAPFANASFAIFQGAAGTVNVDNANGAVQAVGMQFATGGYAVQGGDLVLVDDSSQAGLQSVIRVGDGTAASAGYTATIASNLTGATQLVKTDSGTLVLSGTNTYTGGMAINGGTLRISADANLGAAAGGLSINGGTLNTTASIISARAVNLAGAGTFLTDSGTTLTLNGVVSGAGALTKDGTGDLVLTGANTYTGGTTISSGTLRIGNGGTTGSIVGDVVSTGGTLRFNRSNSVTFAGVYSGGGNLLKEGAGTLILTGNNTSIGTTRIAAGTLQIGSSGTTGSISDASDLIITGPTSALVFNRSDTWTYGGNITIAGAAPVTQAGTGTTILTGSKSGSGSINVAAGTLLMNGNASASSGLTSVASGATLGGTGIIGGSVAVLDGGILAPGSNGVGTLTINGNLALAGASSLAYEFGQSNVVGGPLNDLTQVGGNLTLDGTIDVALAPGGSFGPGLYRVISYGGTLINNGLTAGVMPAGSTVAVQTSVAGQVNLVNAAGGTFNFWDGAAPANESNNLVDGGSGTWQNRSGNNDWTTSTGVVSGPYTDDAFAIFAAAAGTVSVDNSLGAVTASGLQFASDGYTITGQDLSLIGPESTIRVGDGTALGLGYTATIDAALVGSTQVVKADLGTLVLSGTNTYTGGTRIDAGTLRIASDANLGDAAGGLAFNGGTLNTTTDIASSRAVNLLGTGTLSTDTGTSLTLSGVISGAGGFTKSGAGALVLTAANAYLGDTVVGAGSLFVNGDQSAAAGLTSVASGATLGGAGIIGGDVTLADGATLAAGTNNVGTLTVNGNLALSASSVLDFEFGQADLVGGALNDLVNVGGDLTLDGTINVSVPATGSFGPGIYRVFNYGGALVDNGLTLGTMPAGSAVSVQTAVAGQVNLVNTAGLTLSFWDGAAGPKNNSVIEGGNGVWRVGGGSSNWTDASGALNADYAQSSFAIFSAAPGTVTVDNVGGAVLASGMQFASDGYAVAGGPLTLTGAQAIVQVGDGSVAGVGYTARIEAELTGTAGLLKTEAGALVLAGTNSYTGGTQIDAGMLQLGNGGATGSIVGNVTNAGTLAFNRSDSYQFGGVISGSGTLAQLGAGTTILTADNGYTGGTAISAGTLQVGNGGTTGSLGTGNVTNNAALVFNRSNDLSFGGTISGTGTLTKLGAGTLTLTADNGYSGLTTVAAGTLQLGNGGTTGGIAGDVINNGTLTFNRTGNLAYAGAITGTGPVNLLGGGTYDFTGDSNYSGNTNVTASELRLASGGSITTTGTTTISGANGSATVTGAGSALTTDALRVSIGNDDSTLNIENGGLVRVTSTSATQIGAGTGGSTGTGIVNVTGAGSLFDVAGALALGTPVPTVSAIVNVTGGGTILSDSGSIGYAFTGVNTPPVSVTVSGTGSNWTMANALNLRGGSMSILGGGLVSAGSAQIGFAASDVLVSGAGSSLSVTGDAAIGNGAQTTTVALANGGEMSVGGQLTLADAAGSTAILNIGGATGTPTAAGVLDAATLAFGPGTGTLVFNHTDADYGFATALSGSGTILHSAGITRLTGDSSSFTGQTSISGGTLLVNGMLGGAPSVTNVLGGGTLGGNGTIGGDVFLGGGATLAPGSSGVGTLTVNGDLGFSPNASLAFEFGQANVPGGPLNDLVNVGGDLTLDGTINVTQPAGGSFGPGVYRVINYAGALTDNGLTVGTLPGGTAFVQTAVANQINLVNTAGLTLNFWDGPAGPKNDGTIQGGNGTWVLGGGANDWTEVNGLINADYAQDSFAIFQGTGGTVTVDNSGGNVSAAGMQFTVGGYTIAGAPLALTGTQAFVRVGDGGAGDAAITATVGSALTGSAELVKDMGGTLVLTGTNNYTGGTRIDAGTLQLGNGGATGSITGDIVNNGALVTNRSDALSLDGTISGSGSLTQAGGGAVTLTADNSYTGGTTIASGSLSIGNGGATGGIAGDVVNNGVFRLNRSNDYGFASLISGSGSVAQAGSGITTLSGANSYTGATSVNAGTLLVNGNQSAATGLTSVASGATLGGTGIIGGDVVVADGGALAPGAGGAGALTINGNLSLASGSQLNVDFGAANAVGSPLNDVVNVGGDLTLDGTLNVAVTPGGAFDIGLYRIANYGGALTDNGLALGTLPTGADVFVQTAVANQVNLINVGGATLNFWDGAAGPKFNGAVDGGSGVWQTGSGNDNWADATGAVNAGYADGAFAIFTGAAGTVTIDDNLGAVTASGLQFAADGYTITGDALTLSGPQSVIRVGDGTASGAGYTATIVSELSGTTQLVKTDAGTLVLTGANSYTGGTAINGGTVRIASDANLGAAAGGLSLDGGALNTTADTSSARAVTLAGAGTFVTDAGTTLTLGGAITGAGRLIKNGTGTLALAGTGSYTGPTNVGAGTLLVNGNHSAATGATSVASGASLGGTGTIGGDVTLADGATLTPGAGGAGTLTIGGDLSLASGTQLAYEFGQANVAGGALNDLVNVGGDLVLDGTINVSVPTGGAFDPGIYRVFNYGGVLTNNGLTLGTLPGGSQAAVQTSISGQVNLVNSAGLSLAFWDGAAGPKNNGVINGGTGTWQNSTGNDNWADATGAVNAAYSDGAFAIFGGTAGTVTVDNSLGAVTATGMQFAANGYTIAGNPVALTGPQSTIRVGDGSTAGAGFTATINAALSGDTQLVKADAGTLVLGGTNSYTGGTLINGGTVQISADANLGAAAGDVTLDGGTLATSANVTSARDIVMAGAGTIATASGTTFTLSGLLSGTGALTNRGAGTLLLTGNNAGFAGSTRVEGTMIVNGSLCGDVDVVAGGRLGGTGTVCTTVNAGTIAPGNSIGTLTVAGSYTGHGGTLEIETELGGDASPTDRLVVTNGTAGSTTVEVINVGGLGAQTVEGIKIVDVTGGTSAGTFTLNGDYVFEGDQAVIAGAYGYRLLQGGTSTPTDGDWYLRSALLDGAGEPQGPLYQPGVPLYESYAATLQTLNRLGTLQQRVGNRQWSGFTQGGVGMWGRMESTRYRPEAALSTSGSDLDINDWSLQVGFDKALLDTSAGTLIAGVNGRYGKADAQVRSRFGNGEIDTKGYGVGATLTWYDSTGFYADAQAQVSWYRSDLTSGVLGELIDDNHGSGEAFSLEVGKRAPLGGGLSVTPQIQMAYSNVRFDAFADPNGAAVSSDTGSSLKSRWGISVDHQQVWDGANGERQSHLYGIVNLSYEWLDGSVAGVSGTPIARSDHRLWGELGVGGSYSWNGGRFTLFTEVSAETAVNNFGDSNSLKGNAGFRLRF